MKRFLLVCLPALSIAFAGVVSAQTEQSAANKAYMAAMEKMNTDMSKGMDPDPTKAWARMMIAHHQGAIDMSETVLKETKDRAMAESW